MRTAPTIWFLAVLILIGVRGEGQVNTIRFDFFSDSISFNYDRSTRVEVERPLTNASIQNFYDRISSTNYQPIVDAINTYKKQFNLDDWIFYQLIRKSAQQISPKADDYYRYTLYKWFLLVKSGYDATLSIGNDKLLFYVVSNDRIYNIPYRIRDNKQYVCLNYHDYGGNIDFEKEHFTEVSTRISGAERAFSYKITHLPKFNDASYQEKEIQFTYYNSDQKLKVKVNPEIRTLFTNYPILDYNYQFNIPLSKETYSSLINELKKKVSKMNTTNGVDYLMRFTRYAFLFEKDMTSFGKEKRLSPEETLLYDQSDCEDRAALFFYLVREIYDLPMIVLVYPKHVTVAVQLDKPLGDAIVYKGNVYTVCEPTPQKTDIKIGKLAPGLKKSAFEVAYEYRPEKRLAMGEQ